MYTFSKLSLVATFILLIAFIAETFGILDRRYADMIMNVVLAVQLILLAILIVILIIRRKGINGVKMIRYQFSDRFVKGDTYILPEYVSTTNPRKSALFKIFLEIKDIREPPEIGISKIGAEQVVPDIKDHIVNINSGMIENSFIFDADIIVKPGEKINFQLKKDTIIKSFFLGEFYIP